MSPRRLSNTGLERISTIMSNKRWLTKEDIISDLATVTGARVTHIDDRFAVRGERPPPVNVPVEDEDEFVETYGQYTSRDSNILEPDLHGITHMLRMVNEYNDSATYNDNENIKESKKAASTIISISKLNPNVSEFVSKKVRHAEIETNELGNSTKSEFTTQSVNEKTNFQCLETKNDDEIRKIDVSHKNKTSNNDVDINMNIDVFSSNSNDISLKNKSNNNNIDVTKKLDVASLNSNDIKKIREKLKLKIVEPTKTECLQKKRERNLAMATLLKLYTDIPKSEEKNTCPKLMTPEYFQNLPEEVCSDIVKTERDVIKEEIKTEPVTKDLRCVLNIKYPIKESSSSPRITSQESSDLSSNETPDSEKQINHLLISKEVEESVKKVDRWLNGPEKKKHKSRAVYFGPVTFKRKDNVSLNSSETPSLTNADNIETHSTQMSDSYVPSAYANELTKTYTERSQSKPVQYEDMWTKLERELQEKDEAIKKRLLSPQTHT